MNQGQTAKLIVSDADVTSRCRCINKPGSYMIFPRANRPEDMRAVLDLFNRGRLKPGSVISEILPPAVAPEAYATLRHNNDK